MRLLFLLCATAMLFAAPPKKAPLVTNDDDFVPLKKSAPKATPQATQTPSPTETVAKETPAPSPTFVPKKEITAPTPTSAPKVETVDQKPKTTEPPKESVSDLSEVLISKNYLKSDLEIIPKDFVKWDDRNVKSLYIPKESEPYVLLLGRMKENHKLTIDHVEIPLSGGNFEHKLSLPLEPSTFHFSVIKPDGKTEAFPVHFTWIKNPGSIRVRVKEQGDVVEKSVGFSGEIKLTATVQLSIDKEAVAKVDNVQHKKQGLMFTITAPVSEKWDSWSLEVRNSKREIFAQTKKKGLPPPWVEWNDFMPDELPMGKYTYRVSLYTKTGVFDGREEKFEAVEGKILAKESSTKLTFSAEPKEEIGYLTYRNNNSYNTSSLYVGTEIPVLLNNRYILRPGGILALPTTDPENSYYSARALLGFRVNGSGQRLLFFKVPYELQLDILAGLTRFSLSSRALSPQFNHLTLLLQPDLVINGNQFITPLLEWSADSSFQSMRMSVGMVYQFYIKAWSLKWGTGFVYDNLFADPIKANTYSLFRALSSFQFQL